MALFDLNIKNFLKEKMYYSKQVLKKTNNGKKIIKKLFHIISRSPRKFINSRNNINDPNQRLVCDFIAGMTDRFAINLYNKSK